MLRDELPLTSFDPPFVDWIAFDLQTGEQVILRTRNKYELNGDDITHEATCNKVMGELVKGNFKVIMSSAWGW